MVKKTYIPVLVLLLVTGLIIEEESPVRIGIANNTTRDLQGTELRLLVEPREQMVKKRIWEEVDSKLKRSISLERRGIFRPLDVKSDDEGDIYVYDYSTPDIVKFLSSGQLTTRFGMGRGKGPGQLMSPTGFCLDNNGNVWVADPANFMITEFSGDGKLVSTFRPKSMPLRIGALRNGDVAVAGVNATNLIAVYRNGQLIKDFGHVFEQQEKYGFAFDGLLATDSQGNLYYTFTRTGLLLSYHENGSLRFLVKTIDATPLPKLTVSEVNGGISMRFTDPSSFTALSVSVDNGRVYILNYQGAKGLSGMPLDIYNSADGNYICTVMTPGKFLACAVRGNMMYAINDTTLFIFQSKALSDVR